MISEEEKEALFHASRILDLALRRSDASSREALGQLGYLLTGFADSDASPAELRDTTRDLHVALLTAPSDASPVPFRAHLDSIREALYPDLAGRAAEPDGYEDERLQGHGSLRIPLR